MEKGRNRVAQLEAISWVVAHWADYLTDEVCSAASGHTNHLCGQATKVKLVEFIDRLAKYLETTFQCNAVTMFLEDITGKRLGPVGESSHKLTWPDSRCYYADQDAAHLTWKCWKEREMVFSSSASTGRAREVRSVEDHRDMILFAPLARRGGHCHGVVRLHNKRLPGDPVSTMFTDDDAAKLDAIIQTALPHLELLKLQQQQIESLARMVHEFQIPLIAIRGAVDLMQSDLRKRNEPPERFFRRDFLDDVLQWTELMGHLATNTKVFAGGAERLRPQKTLLLADVIMPALRQIRPLVPHGIRFDNHHEGLIGIPALWLDRNQMQQVFFNLLSNSIKYGGSTESVRVSIIGGSMGLSYSIFFNDWGSGIDEAHRTEVFQPGFRGERAILSDVGGQGLGLYVIRSIIEAHGGTINVRSCRNPTTFEVALPHSLRHQKPSPPVAANE